MKTHDIESDLEGLKEDVFPGLAPEDRARAVVEFEAARDERVTEALHETAPAKRYEATDLEFVDAVHRYREAALYALWELETGAWRFLYEARDRMSPDVEMLDEDEAGDAEVFAAEHLATYHAWERYATEDVGVTLREFLLHPLAADAETHVDRIAFAADLADGSVFGEGDEADGALGWAADTVTVDGREFTLDELADQKYAQITGELGGGD